MNAPTRYWTRLEDGRVQCDVCPRRCRMRAGQRGFCFVRAADEAPENGVVLTTWGRSSGFCVDPIEKKPLNHFLPGSAVLSFGTAGCNLACRFCQNWDLSKSREMDTLADAAEPETIARTARELGCKSVAFTYNDPVVFLEYAVDVARACRASGIRTVAVTAGYVEPRPRAELFRHVDAANVDLKAFDERFYAEITGGHLEPVLDTLRWLVHETDVWVEITTLVIPGLNDGDEEIERMAAWVVRELGPDVPMHFSAFHPDWKMRDRPTTPPATLARARRLALDCGVHHVYTGNVRDPEGDATRCAACGELLIARDTYEILSWCLAPGGCCPNCGERCAGVFEEHPGRWGARRLPVRLAAREPG